MQCPDESHVELFIRGELEAEQVSQFEAHLDVCEPCLARIAKSVSGSAERLPGSITSKDQDSAFVHLVAALARRSDVSPSLEIPTRESFGPYRVLGFLARGAMGLVYEAIHEGTGQKAAIKVVAPGSPRLLPAMRQEIAFLEQQHHPGIVRIFEHGLIEGDPWYAMELLEGKTLEDFNRSLWRREGDATSSGSSRPRPEARNGELALAAGGRLNDVLALYSLLCVPLGFVHRAGFVHCDLKPANVFIRDDAQPVLMDFGLLSRAGGAIGRERLEVGGRLRGTLPYLSPELIRGQIPDARADLYALGCMLYESVTGRPPFLAKTANGFLEAHLHAEAEPASRYVAGVPQVVEDLLATLLSKLPASRIGDADVVAERCSRAQTVDSRPPASPSRTLSIPSAPYLFRPRMVGRDDVMGRIQELRADAQRGQGRILLVGGESGIGKTFLASEVAQRAVRAGFEVVAGECTPVAATVQGDQEIVSAALEPFRKLLQNAADRCRDAGVAAAIRLFGSERSIALLARYEPALVHLLDGAAVQPIAALPPVAERERVLQALSDLVRQMATESPLLIVIDDLQWADDLSLSFLDFLSGADLTGQQLLVIALYRSEEVSKPITELEAKPGVQSLRLDRLDASTLTALVGDLLSDRPPAEFVQALAKHSEGNPFFVAEYLRAGAAEGLLERTAAGWKLGASKGGLGYEALALPASLQALLERRLALLAPSAQRVTEAAAVLGREIPVAMLPAVAGVTASEVNRAIEEMLQRQIVHRVSPEALRFLHDKLREAAYGRVDSEQRRTLHRAAADVIETTYASSAELPAHFAELAYHLRHAGEFTRAVDYFEKAGEHALRSSANADAVRFLGEANQLVVTEAMPVPAMRRASWERMAGDALHGLGDLERSQQHLLQAVDYLGWPMPKEPFHIALAILAKVVRQAFHRLVPRRWIEADARRSNVLLEGARAYDRLQQLYYHRGEYVRLVLAMLTTLNLSERALPSSYLATAYTNAGATAGIIPLRSTAVRYFELAEGTLAKAYDAEVEMYLRQLHAVYLTGLGQWERAAAAANRSLELANKLGFRRSWEETAGVLGIATNDFDERLEWVRRSLESALRRGDPQMTSWGFLRTAEVYAARGDFARASEAVDKVEAMLPRLGTLEQLWLFATRSFLLLANGNRGDAGPMVDRASALAKKTGPTFVGLIEAYTRIAQVQLAAWTSSPGQPPNEGQRKARAACAMLAAAGRIFPIAIPSYCLCEGTRRWKLGKTKQAVAMWDRGLLEARRLGLPYREAQLLVTLAEHLRDPQAAQDARALGTQIATRLGVGNDSVQVLNANAHSAE